jgi:cytochrome P450
VYWCGSETRLVVKEPEIAKVVFGAKHEDFKRSEIENLLAALIMGNGLFHWFGPKWTKERQTLNPFFHNEALKVNLTPEISKNI